MEVLEVYAMSRLNNIEVRIQKPPYEIRNQIVSHTSIFNNSQSYFRITKFVVFLDKQYRGIGVPNLRHKYHALKTGLVKRIYSPQSFQLTLVADTIITYNILTSNIHTTQIIVGGQNLSVTHKRYINHGILKGKKVMK